mmetsp:Transcript_25077/g.47968  ORF Transcript_25077/g.47968 Transcript_25077/m.47968 type:complete len:131 (-) Transcript_25077:400-792(-)
MTSLSKAAGTLAATRRGVEKHSISSLSSAFLTRANNTTQEKSSSFSSDSNSNDGTTTATTNTGSGDGDDHFGVWQPNQTTVIFQRMEETCPDVMKTYARCVIDKQNGGALVQGACDESFQAVMNCFRSVR